MTKRGFLQNSSPSSPTGSIDLYSSIADAYAEQGYAIVDLFGAGEHARLQGLVENRLREIAEKNFPGRRFDPSPLELYHRQRLPEELHRVLTAPQNRYIRISNEIESVLTDEKLFPVFRQQWRHTHATLENRMPGREPWSKEQVMFRLVRPGVPDVGGIHTEAGYGIFPISIWTPIAGFDERYTLRLAPGSHLVKHPSEMLRNDARFMAKPFADEYTRNFRFVRPTMKKGQAIVFHPDLLHGASRNEGDQTRVSLEFRLYG